VKNRSEKGGAREHRRREILNAATKAFADKGYHPTTIEEISKAVKLAKGTLYLYFSGKEALFLAVIEDGVQRMVELIDETSHLRGSIHERLTILLNGLLMFHWERQDFFRLFIKEAATLEKNSQDELRRRCMLLHEALLSHLDRIMGKAIEQGELRKIDPSTLSTLFLAIVHSLSYRGLCCATLPDFAASAPLIVDCFLHGVQAEAKKPEIFRG
jgi:AcrR family transcriptional regulator